jgi:hypothetical protein
VIVLGRAAHATNPKSGDEAQHMVLIPFMIRLTRS